MKGQRGWQNAEPFGDDASWQALGTDHDQQAEHLQPGLLRQRRKRGQRGFLIHRRVTLTFRVNPKYGRMPEPSMDHSRIVEIIRLYPYSAGATAVRRGAISDDSRNTIARHSASM